MSAAVLLAEPEPETHQLLARHLADDGFDVVTAPDAPAALELAEQARPDLVLLDALRSRVRALDVCRRLREGEPGRSWNRRVPVIVLGPEDADAIDRVRAFDRGCDDYVVRPFVYDELLARMRALLRRSSPPREVLEADGITIDQVTRRVTVHGRRVALAGKEYELLVALAADPTRVFTKDELLRDVWGFRSRARTRTLDSHASRLRRKLAGGSDDEFVVNVWGVGYKLFD
jgi:DNA-binding response OmpR family regulator